MQGGGFARSGPMRQGTGARGVYELGRGDPALCLFDRPVELGDRKHEQIDLGQTVVRLKGAVGLGTTVDRPQRLATARRDRGRWIAARGVSRSRAMPYQPVVNASHGLSWQRKPRSPFRGGLMRRVGLVRLRGR